MVDTGSCSSPRPTPGPARIQGIVILEATITPQGRVQDVKVLRGVPALDEAAVEAVRQWTYTPTLLGPGDSIYLDAQMGHCFVAEDGREAVVLFVVSEHED